MIARAFAFSLIFLAAPIIALGATVAADESVNVSVSPNDNAYLAGTEVRVTAPLPADLLAAAGTLLVTAPVVGDALMMAGTVDITAPVEGDVRVLGGRVRIEGEVKGDIAVLGGAVSIIGKGNEIRVAGGTVELRGGATGPVTIYGGTVYLSGEFAGDVKVVASDHITVGEGTTIQGTLSYNAPQEAGIPTSASIVGGVTYTGSSSFLPTVEEAHTFALAGVGVFFIVRLVAGALAAGLVVGVFPLLARRVADEVLTRSWKRFVLLMLLGLAVMVVTPVFIIFLVASFVGIGIAALVGAAYVLLLLLSYLYAALLAGAVVMRTAFKRSTVSWKSAILGMVILYLINLIPGAGLLVTFVLTAVALGTLTHLFYRLVFSRAEID